MTTTDDGSTKPGEMSGRVDSAPDKVPAAAPALPPSSAAQALGNGSGGTAQTCGVDAKQSDYAEALADSPLMRFKEMPRAMFNPLQGCGRGKTWAEDAKAQLAFIEFKLAAIRARNQAVCEKGGVERQLREWWLGTTPLSDSHS